MLNTKNKTQLLRLLRSEWQTDRYASWLHGRSVYFVCEEEVLCLSSEDGVKTVATHVELLYSEQEEADTRIILHCLFAASSEPVNIIVRSPDTDVLILLLYYCATIKLPVYFDTGTGNKRRLIDVKSIAAAVGSEVCSALPGLHHLPDATIHAFVRRGKVKAFKLLLKHQELMPVFLDLGKTVTLSDEISVGLEKFVCAMYGRPSYSDANKLRYDLFSSRYEMKSESKPFTMSQGVDLCLLPPCRSSLIMHSRRANYVAHVWRNSHIAYAKIPSPVDFGWKYITDSLVVDWNEGDIMPQQLVDILDTTDSQSSRLDCEEIEEVKLEEVEEDCEIDNIVDVIFEDDEFMN